MSHVADFIDSVTSWTHTCPSLTPMTAEFGLCTATGPRLLLTSKLAVTHLTGSIVCSLFTPLCHGASIGVNRVGDEGMHSHQNLECDGHENCPPQNCNIIDILL